MAKRSGHSLAGLVKWMAAEAQRQPIVELEGSKYLRMLAVYHAINGDESFADYAITDLYWRVVHNQMEPEHRAALALLLMRLRESSAGRKIAAGVEGRGGQPRRGFPGLMIASEVADAIKNQSLTAEAAWEAVGAKHHLTGSAVKGHWMRWKPRLIDGAKEFVRAKFPRAADDELAVLAKVAILGSQAMTPTDAQVWVRVTVEHQDLMIDGQSTGRQP